MLEHEPRTAQPTELLAIIAEVRRRWRLKLAMRGTVRVVIVAMLLVLAATYGIEWARSSGASILVSRVGFAVVLLASAYWFVVRPLRRRVSDDQVALYLEEHEPSLEATLLSAVEASRAGHGESAALIRRVIEQAIAACQRVNATRALEAQPLRRYSGVLAAAAVAALLAVALGPSFIRQGLAAMFLMPQAQAAARYRIEVKPGSSTVPKGSDQTITAKLLGFDAEDANLMVKRTPTGKFEPLPLQRTESGAYEGLLFDINGPLEYFVEADGVRSETFAMQVVEVPYVQRLELEFAYPAYTGLQPQKIEDGGDIAVLKGATVKVHVFPTMKTAAGRLALNDSQQVPLVVQPDGTLIASFVAEKDGAYVVQLQAPNGEFVVGSPKYAIDVLEDGAPTVSFNRPGRDTTASAVEEVFVEAKAVDDYGVRNLELVYSVNGGAEKVVPLFQGKNRLPEVTAGHTFYLEEMGLQVGDSVSYYARAMDNDGGGAAAKKASSDLYFVRIRPFNKDFKQAQSQGGGGGGGGGGGAQIEALSEQQRQIISATFNVQRDRKNFTQDKLKQSSTVVALSQSRLREQVESMLTRMNSQLVEKDPKFQKIAELLPEAVKHMQEAESKLTAINIEAALPIENKALQALQKAEEEFELQVQAGRQGGGGGGGGGGAMQQELAELFEQDIDKIASRYETANQAAQQQNDREVDELLEKLKELARRQEQEAERQRRKALEGGQQAGQGGSSGGSGSAQQRALADQVEEAARRLERLAREQERQDLLDSARQMKEAADAMRRAAAGGDANAAAQAQAALERLRETERKLQGGKAQRAERDVENARAQAEDIARRQQEIADGAKKMGAQGSTERAQQARQLSDKKDALEAKIGELESSLDRAARDAAGDEKAASRKLSEAAGAVRDSRLKDKVRFSKQLVSRGRSQDDINAMEGDIADGIDAVRKKLDEAQSALGQGGQGDKKEQALDRARRLARNLESLQERTRERAQPGKDGQKGRDGQGGDQQGKGQDGKGQQSQQARNGQQDGKGQQGQRGQGQQGQNGQGQGQGQGQQGQQGQGGQQGEGQQGGQGGGDGQRADGGGNRGDFNGFDRGGVGGWNGAWGGWWDGRRLSPEDIRQLRNEARQYSNDARDLRGVLRGESIDANQLDEVISKLKELEDDRIYQDVGELARMQAFVAEGLKRFEFGLRRKVEGDASAAALSGTDDVPTEFKALVEQYYRSLARSGK